MEGTSTVEMSCVKKVESVLFPLFSVVSLELGVDGSVLEGHLFNKVFRRVYFHKW